MAHNQLAGELRRGTRRGELAAEHVRAAFESTIEAPFVSLSGDVRDDLASAPAEAIRVTLARRLR